MTIIMPSSILFTCDKYKNNELIKGLNLLCVPKQQTLLEKCSKVTIGKTVYNESIVIEEVHIILRLVKVEWYKLQSMILSNNTILFSDMLASRHLINRTFYELQQSLLMCESQLHKARSIAKMYKALKSFATSVLPINCLEKDVLLKFTTSTMNSEKNPVYQYFHTYLEIQYYLLTLDYICDPNVIKNEDRLLIIMKDLIIICKNNYIRHSGQTQQDFLCSCIQSFWLILQYFMDKINTKEDYFWTIFNKLLEDEEPTFSLLLLRDISNLRANSLLSDDGEIRNINPNYSLLQMKLKAIFINAESNTLLECLKIIEPLLCQLWLKDGKIEIFQNIWDYYSKRLNITNKTLVITAFELNELRDNLLLSIKECEDDFGIFVGMLINHLREYPSHWAKMKGRIYSQLGPHKVKDLNDSGITRIVILFMCLASINYEELSKKIISFLQNLPSERKSTRLIWNLYVAFIIQHVRECRDLEMVIPFIKQELQDACCDKKKFPLIKEFITNFHHIINYSASMQLHQWLLLDSWITKYLATCYYSDLNAALEVILFTLTKVNTADSWSYWEPTFKDNIYPALKQISNSSCVPPAVGKIAGKLCLLIPNITTDAFNFFNSDNMSAEVSCQFLSEVLENYPNSCILSPQQETVAIQSWIKICLLTMDFHEDFTKHILKLDYFQPALKAHIQSSKDPVHALIEYLGSDIKQHIQSNNINKLCEISFGQIDKWLPQYLIQPENEAVVYRIYSCISLAFFHCGLLLYNRNKSTSPLTRLVQTLLLPTDFLIGKAPHMFVLNAVRKTWHIFFEAFVKLNEVTDTFIERTMRDMILKYMQYFPTTDSPIIKCLENEKIAPIILEKISNYYFKHPVKESDANVLKVLKIFSDFIQSTTSLPLLKMIVNRTLYGLFEVVIFHLQRNAAINLVKTITCSPLYCEIKTDFKNSVVIVTEKHLAFNTINYFQLMYILAKFVPNDIKSLLETIKQQVSNVERMRGVGFDKNLRSQFEKLESILEIHK